MNTPQDARTNFDWVYLLIPAVIIWLYAVPSREDVDALKRDVKLLEQQVNRLSKEVRG